MRHIYPALYNLAADLGRFSNIVTPVLLIRETNRMRLPLMFQNGDWLMTSFKATNTQNVPVFFHAFNNEDSILD